MRMNPFYTIFTQQLHKNESDSKPDAIEISTLSHF